MNSGELVSTPIVDILAELTHRDIVSFHALPISRKKSISNSALYKKYKQLFGEDYYRAEMTITGENFDTPILPSRCIKRSEELTSKAFGAKKSYYITMGTTTANRIVINALAEYGSRVLVDKSCHLSVHFGIRDRNCNTTYIEHNHYCKASGRSYLDVRKVVSKFKKANREGRPYKLIIFNGCSYEGVFYDLKSVIRECIKTNDKVNFLVDEAWLAFGYFHEQYRKYTAMQIAADLQAEMPDKRICIVATQSAHKSLSAFRQGSYIHAFGDSSILQKILENKFCIHTTSPSYPILASLELARAQAVMEGTQLIEEQLQIAKYFCKQIKENKKLSQYSINGSDFIIDKYKELVFIDPLKVSINLSKLKVMPKEFIRFAFDKFGIYINRYCNKSVLININIGVKKQDIITLLNAMAEFQQAKHKNKDYLHLDKVLTRNEPDYQEKLGTISEYFVIPYPPGVPLLFKGDKLDCKVAEKIKTLKENGVDLIFVK